MSNKIKSLAIKRINEKGLKKGKRQTKVQNKTKIETVWVCTQVSVFASTNIEQEDADQTKR